MQVVLLSELVGPGLAMSFPRNFCQLFVDLCVCKWACKADTHY